MTGVQTCALPISVVVVLILDLLFKLYWFYESKNVFAFIVVV